MRHKFSYSVAAVAILASAAAFSQTGASSAALPSAPGAAADPPGLAAGTPGAKIAAINVEQAIFNCNEGRRDMEALSKKFEPKSNELKTRNEEIEALKKQLTAAGLTDEKKADIQRQVETKQKALERDTQDARDDFQSQQNEIGQRILQKMAPVIMKYANANGLGMIIDTSTPWPSGPVLYSAPLDITKAIVDSYNAQSGVAPPPTPSGTTGSSSRPSSRPSSSRPAGGTSPAK